MPACPNCGRETLRTEDWACQWCGYPLLSKAYKKIPKTFKELQEERRQGAGLSEPEHEPAPGPQPAPAPEPQAAPTPQPAPVPERQPEPQSAPAPEPQPAPAPTLQPQSQPATEPQPAPEPQPQPEQPPAPPPAPQPAPAPGLEAAPGEITVSVDELSELFLRDKLAAHASLTGKTFRVTGVVGKVFVRDHLDIRYVVLAGNNKSGTWGVRCEFSRENMSQFSQMAIGQAVAVRGKYDGYSKNIIIKDCVLA